VQQELVPHSQNNQLAVLIPNFGKYEATGWLFPDKWILRYNGPPIHSAFCTGALWEKKSIELMERLACSSDLVPSVFLFFPNTKNRLKRFHFETVANCTTTFRENALCKSFHNWKQSLNSCMAAEDNYSDEPLKFKINCKMALHA
jgi:hypothetical protein